MPERVRRLLAARRPGKVVVLTGAGVSAESGIPTFRGKEGFWTIGSRDYHPMELATFSAFTQMPDDVWSWYLYRRTVCNRAKPNPGHRSLVALEEALGDQFLLITQNVDGLHLRAGNSPERTYQIHGNIDFMRCSQECSFTLYPIGDRAGPKEKGEGLTEEERRSLVCPACGARARPHVLWFDEAYDEPRFRYRSSMAAAEDCSVLVIVGTSGATNLPNQVAYRAAAAGALLIDVNPEAQPFSKLAQASGGLWLQLGAGEGLPPIVEQLVARA
ncbi:MAG: RNA polymerase subunit sigma [Armatimonadetes bacterium]|nr:RNA polymerase subunit sigma [Armatimonadota bacterium]